MVPIKIILIFYTNIKQKVSEFENDHVIMCGDWNFVLDPDQNYDNYLHINNPKARKSDLR